MSLATRCTLLDNLPAKPGRRDDIATDSATAFRVGGRGLGMSGTGEAVAVWKRGAGGGGSVIEASATT